MNFYGFDVIDKAILISLSIVGVIIIIFGSLLIAKRRLDTTSCLGILLNTTFIPILMIFIILGYAFEFYILISDKLFEAIFSGVLIIEMIIILLYLIFRINFNQHSKFAFYGENTTHFDKLNISRKIYNTSIYSAIINVLVVVSLRVILNNELSIRNSSLENLLSVIIFYLVAFLGFSVTYLLVFNGNIRTFITSKGINGKVNVVVFVLLMFVPIVNIICCAILSKKIKSELLLAGYKVGMFEVQSHIETSEEGDE